MKEEKTMIEKIQKTCRIGRVVTTIFKIFGIVMSVVAVLMGVVLVGESNRINQVLKEAVEVEPHIIDGMDFLEATMLKSLLEEENFATVIGLELLVAGAILICSVIVVHFVGKVFKEMEESYSPFQPSIIKNLKVVFVLVTLLALSSSLATGLIAGLALWCVIHIFEYGCELQRLSDETL